MGWDRGNYYQSERVCGKPRRVYIGKGRTAKAAAKCDASQRRERQARIEAWSAERAEIEALDRRLDELDDLADLLAEAALVAAGYRQHHRGEWRKQRGRHD